MIMSQLTAEEDEKACRTSTPAVVRRVGRMKATTVGHFITVTAAKPTTVLMAVGLSMVMWGCLYCCTMCCRSEMLLSPDVLIGEKMRSIINEYV